MATEDADDGCRGRKMQPTVDVGAVGKAVDVVAVAEVGRDGEPEFLGREADVERRGDAE